MTLPPEKTKELMVHAVKNVKAQYTTKKFNIFPVLDTNKLLEDYVRLVVECAILTENLQKLEKIDTIKK